MNFKTLTLTVLLVCIAEATQAQQSAKEIFDMAEIFYFSNIFDGRTDIEDYSYIPWHDTFCNIESIDGADISSHIGLIPAGVHSLLLHYRDITFDGHGVARMIRETRQVDLKAGTSYSFVWRGKELVMEEDSVNKMAFIISFKTYPEAHPDRLEGVWSGETKRLMTPYSMRCSITGNRMMFESTSGKRVFTVEGRIYYNENTIVLIPDKATANGKDAEKLGFMQTKKRTQNPDGPKFIWYYTLADGMLHLESNEKFVNKGLMWENDGEFRKTD